MSERCPPTFPPIAAYRVSPVRETSTRNRTRKPGRAQGESRTGHRPKEVRTALANTSSGYSLREYQLRYVESRHRAVRGQNRIAMRRSVRGPYAGPRRCPVRGAVISRECLTKWTPRLRSPGSDARLLPAGGLGVAQVSRRSGSVSTSCQTSGAPTPPNTASCRSRRPRAGAALRDTRPAGGRRQPQNR